MKKANRSDKLDACLQSWFADILQKKKDNEQNDSLESLSISTSNAKEAVVLVSNYQSLFLPKIYGSSSPDR